MKIPITFKLQPDHSEESEEKKKAYWGELTAHLSFSKSATLEHKKAHNRLSGT